MGGRITGVLGCIPKFQVAMLKTGGIVDLVLVVLCSEVFHVITMYSGVVLSGFWTSGFGIFSFSVGVSWDRARVSVLHIEHVAWFLSIRCCTTHPCYPAHSPAGRVFAAGLCAG